MHIKTKTKSIIILLSLLVVGGFYINALYQDSIAKEDIIKQSWSGTELVKRITGELGS